MTTFRWTTPRRPRKGPLLWADRPTCESCVHCIPHDKPTVFTAGGVTTSVMCGDCSASVHNMTSPLANKACLNHTPRKEPK